MKREKFDIFSVLWTILLHALAIVLLLVLHLNKPVAQAESGVPVMLGNMGNLDTDYEFTEVNSMPAPAPAAVPVPAAPQAEPAITQNLEETVAIESGEKEKPVKAGASGCRAGTEPDGKRLWPKQFHAGQCIHRGQ